MMNLYLKACSIADTCETYANGSTPELISFVESNHMEAIIRYTTESGSVYEVDYTNRKARRISGESSPTRYFGDDGEWQEFVELVTDVHGSLAFVWQAGPHPDGLVHYRTTITSPVVSQERVQ